MTGAVPGASEWTPSVEPVNLGEGTAYAYILDYNTDLGTPVLARLLQDGVTRVAKRRSSQVGRLPAWVRGDHDATTKRFGTGWADG